MRGGSRPRGRWGDSQSAATWRSWRREDSHPIIPPANNNASAVRPETSIPPAVPLPLPLPLGREAKKDSKKTIIINEKEAAGSKDIPKVEVAASPPPAPAKPEIKSASIITKLPEAKILAAAPPFILPLRAGNSRAGTSHSFCVFDVEACDPSAGPVRAIGALHIRYSYDGPRLLVRRFQVAVRRTAQEYTARGAAFWNECPVAHAMLDKLAADQTSSTEEFAIREFSRFLHECWEAEPQTTVLYDDPAVDIRHLNNLCTAYGLPSINYDRNGTYHPLYNSRDIMRGAFGGSIDLTFMQLDQPNMYRAIAHMWNRKFTVDRSRFFVPVGSISARTGALKPAPTVDPAMRQRHLPLHDAWITADFLCQVYDLVYLVHQQSWFISGMQALFEIPSSSSSSSPPLLPSPSAPPSALDIAAAAAAAAKIVS